LREEDGMPGWMATPWSSETHVLLRLVSATLAGGVIGWNRHRVGKPAGIGTFALVALGAGLFVSIPAAGGSSTDALSRTIQGVAAGVGFLGAGEIFRGGSSNRIVGLTSAAALWATAGLGITIVAASMTTSLLATALVMAVLELAPRIERSIGPANPRENETQ
jgi:putative Mg2+ transporter-C (MgtC) family protein